MKFKRDSKAFLKAGADNGAYTGEQMTRLSSSEIPAVVL
jgi:hypothetical protein